MKISQQKQDKIAEQILNLLYNSFPKSLFTSQIAQETARDEEFTLKLLKDLEAKKLVISINKNSAGKDFIRRKKWRISSQAYEAYKQHQ